MAKKGESTTISFRLSVEEKILIIDAALELEISMSDFMLMKILQEDRLIPIYLETVTRNIDSLDSGEVFYISEQLPANWKIISKRTRKKLLKKVIGLMDDGDIEASYFPTEEQVSNKDLLCKKSSCTVLDLLDRINDDDD